MGNIQNSVENQSVQAILKELFSFRRFGMRPGLENIRDLLGFWDDPQQSFASIHVAGTNGKGTVSSLIASILSEAGYKTGLYTSPHILHFNERIRVNGAPISNPDLARLAAAIMPRTREIRGTFFEATTALAFRYFAEQEVEIAVIETGMGGRLDSTNVLAPLVSVITSIDMDHAAYLGDSLAMIAAEKAAIMKRKVPAVIGEQRTELFPVFLEKALEVSAPLCFLNDAYTTTIREWKPQFRMLLDIATPARTLSGLESDLAGAQQARNCAIAIAALDQVTRTFPVEEQHIRAGVRNCRANTGLRGRTELLQAQPPFILDVAHNPSGCRALVQTLADCGYAKADWNVVFGAMADKAVEEMLAAFLPVCDTLYCCNIADERAMPNADIAARARELGFAEIELAGTVESAVKNTLERKSPTLFVGSFYLAEEVLKAHPGWE